MKIKTYEKIIPVDEFIEGFVRVEKFLPYCRDCGNYDSVWSCPPFDFDPVRDVWRRFGFLRVVGRQMFLEEEEKEDWAPLMRQVKKQLGEELLRAESSNPGSISLSAGSCDVCGKEKCSRPLGLACRFPEKMRYSIEALGGDVGLICERLLGVKLQWAAGGKLPDFFMLVCGLLYNGELR